MPYMEYTEVRNPKWATSNNTMIACEVNFTALGWVEFACNSQEDVDFPHTKEIYDKIVNGDFGAIEDFTYPEKPTAHTHLGGIISSLLAEHYTSLKNDPLRWEALSAEKQQEWEDWKQAVIDLRSSTPDSAVVWSEENQSYTANVTFPALPE